MTFIAFFKGGTIQSVHRIKPDKAPAFIASADPETKHEIFTVDDTMAGYVTRKILGALRLAQASTKAANELAETAEDIRRAFDLAHKIVQTKPAKKGSSAYTEIDLASAEQQAAAEVMDGTKAPDTPLGALNKTPKPLPVGMYEGLHKLVTKCGSPHCMNCELVRVEGISVEEAMKLMPKGKYFLAAAALSKPVKLLSKSETRVTAMNTQPFATYEGAVREWQSPGYQGMWLVLKGTGDF